MTLIITFAIAVTLLAPTGVLGVPGAPADGSSSDATPPQMTVAPTDAGEQALTDWQQDSATGHLNVELSPTSIDGRATSTDATEVIVITNVDMQNRPATVWVEQGATGLTFLAGETHTPTPIPTRERAMTLDAGESLTISITGEQLTADGTGQSTITLGVDLEHHRDE